MWFAPLKPALLAGALWAAAGGVLAPTSAAAQALTPMLGETRSMSDVFAIRVQAKNPYKRKIRLHMRAYDARFRPLRARISPASFMLGAGAQRSVLVRLPFGGANVRKLRICAESIPFPEQALPMRAQVCGRYRAQRIR